MKKIIPYLLRCAVSDFRMAILGLAICCLWPQGAWGNPDSKRILLLFSYHTSYPLAHHLSDNVFRALQHIPEPYSLESFELNSLQNPDPAAVQKRFELLRPEIENGQYDIILTFSDHALRVLRSNVSAVPAHTDLVFAHCRIDDDPAQTPLPRSTGVFVPSLLQKNIELGRTLFPHAKTAYLVTGTLAGGRNMQQQWRRIDESGVNPIRMEVLGGADLTTAELRAKLTGLKDSFVIFHNWTNPGTENINGQRILTEDLISACAVPVLVQDDMLLQYGAVGGYMTRGEEIGRQVGQIIRKLLGGADIKSIPAQPEQAFYVGNAKAFAKHRTGGGVMPPETLWLFYEPSFFEAHIVGLLISATFTLLSVALLVLFIIYRRSVRFHLAIFRALPIRIVIGDASGKLFFHNTASSAETSIEAVAEEIGRVVADGKPRIRQYREGDGARTAYVTLLPDKIFKRRAAISVSLDSTELQKTQDELRNSEERMRLTLTSIGDGVIATDDRECITMLNSVAEQLTGYSTAEARGLPLEEVFRIRSYHDDSVVQSPIAVALREKRVVALANHTDLIRRDGTRYHIADSAAPILDASSRCLGAILVFRDVTQAYNERDNMRYKQLIMERASEVAHLGYFVFDIARQRLENTLSLPVGETDWSGDDILANLGRWMLPEDYRVFTPSWERLLAGDSTTEKVSFRAGAPQAPNHYMVFMQVLITDGKERKIVGLVQDLSDVKKFEEQYLDTLALLHSFIQVFPTPACIKDIDDDYRYLCANDSLAGLLRIERAQIIGKNDFDLNADPEVARKIRDGDLRLEAGEEPSVCLEKVIFNHRECYFRSVKIVFTSPAGRRYLLGLSFDVTSEELAKQQQYETQLLLREIIDNLPVMVTVKSPDQEFRYLHWNTATALHTGIAQDTAAEKSDFDIFKDVSRAEFFRNMDLKVLAGGQQNFLLEMSDTRGEMHQFDALKKLFRMPSGKQLILSLYRDVTVEKQMQAAQLTMIDQLTKHVDYERLFNGCLHGLLLTPELDSAADELLRKIGETISADRCYIFQYSADGNYASNLYEWCSDHVSAAKHTLQNLPLAAVEPWYRALLTENRVLIDDVSTLSGEWEAIRAILEPQGIRSLLCSSIVINGKHWGFMGIDFVKATHAIAECDRLLLSGAVHIFSLAWERHLQNEAVARSVSLQRQTFESVSIPLVLFDLQHNIIDVNPSACQSVGKTREELTGRKCHEALCGLSQPPAWCPMAASLAELRPVTIPFDGHGRHYLVTNQPILDKTGKPLYILESAVDISDLHMALEAANAAGRAKNIFLATMSHEIRTPLNAVIGFSELLQNDALPPEESKEYLHSINLAGNALLNLINDILELSKLEANQMKIVPARNDLRTLCEEVRSIFAMQARSKAIAFEMNYAPDLPLLFLDLSRLRQILFNLTGNAVKFTREGKIIVQVNFRKKAAENGELTIQITDSGIGITPEFQSKMFDPFAQQENGIRGTRTQAGTGLGLTICKRLAEAMNGELTYAPNPVGGSCFTLELHAVRYEAISADDPVLPVVSPALPVASRKLLLVDDVALNLKVLQAMLRPFPVELRMASSGAEALEVLHEFHPDLILTDMWMPGMNGAALAARIRSLPEFPAVKIYAVTADSETEQTFSMEAFDGVLLKPLSHAKLRKMFEQIDQEESRSSNSAE